jgi:hypothetical protein
MARSKNRFSGLVFSLKGNGGDENRRSGHAGLRARGLTCGWGGLHWYHPVGFGFETTTVVASDGVNAVGDHHRMPPTESGGLNPIEFGE